MEFYNTSGGIGNRINQVANVYDPDRNQMFYWPIDRHCQARWSDIFTIPLNTTEQEFHVAHKNRGENRCITPPFLYMRKEENGRHIGVGLMASLLTSLTPSVEEVMLKLPEGVEGYYIRALHPKRLLDKRVEAKLIDVPAGYFMATDSSAQRQHCRSCYQLLNVPVTNADTDTRDLERVIYAVADWVHINRDCVRVYDYSLPFEGMLRYHSTFLDARRLLGRETINNCW